MDVKKVLQKIETWCKNNPYEYVEYDIDTTDLISIAGRCESLADFEDQILPEYLESDMIAYIETENFKKCISELNFEKYRNSDIWDSLLTTFFDNFNIKINIDNLLNKKINTNIIFNFYNDLNTDYTGNGWMRWLMKSQGYNMRDYPVIVHTGTYYSNYINKKFELSDYSKVNNSESKFIKSLYNECYNMPNEYIRMLTLCCKLTIEEYLIIYEFLNNKKFNNKLVLKVNTKCTLGLFNNWSGSGSMLDIELEKPLTINGSNISIIQLESNHGERIENNRCYGYTVNEVYGMGSDAWIDSTSLQLLKCHK